MAGTGVAALLAMTRSVLGAVHTEEKADRWSPLISFCAATDYGDLAVKPLAGSGDPARTRGLVDKSDCPASPV